VDIEDIERVVTKIEHAQRHELVDDFVALFRHDAIWTTSHGRLLTGRDEIAAFTRQVLPGAMAELTASYEVTHVLAVQPDVVEVKVRQRYFTRAGEPADEEGEGTPLFVMSRENGQWLLTACQNTAVFGS
jgi:uncharacterized protein (TIGR02246 family)